MPRQNDMPDRQILACDLGGTRMRIALVSLQGHVHDKQVVLSLDNNPNTLIDALRTALEQAPGKIEGAVIGVPGMVDYHNQEVVKLPNLAAWEGTISGQRLSDALGLETLLANDADLGALGEYRYGAGRGSQDIVYVAAGTGVGSGVVLNGRLLKGRFSLGEIGHTIIDRTTGGTVEELASGIALRRSLGLDVSELAERAAKGDPEATRVFDELCRDLSIGIYNLGALLLPGTGRSWRRYDHRRRAAAGTHAGHARPGWPLPPRLQRPCGQGRNRRRRWSARSRRLLVRIPPQLAKSLP